MLNHFTLTFRYLTKHCPPEHFNTVANLVEKRKPNGGFYAEVLNPSFPNFFVRICVQITCSGIAQVYTGENQKWNLKGTGAYYFFPFILYLSYLNAGVACFVRDSSKKSHFIRVVDPDTNEELATEEVYKEFDFVSEANHQQFLCFAGKVSFP